uniref:RING-type domain-containing protein n=1 Tax=Homalodisca liturata TaxID=320908 RepID=A0A1B6IE76_9HEMI
MPIQAPQWTEFLSCPVCCNEFDATLRSPVSLACAHTVCKTCLVNLHRKQCPFDQTPITTELEKLPVNTALLQLSTMVCHGFCTTLRMCFLKYNKNAHSGTTVDGVSVMSGLL